MRVLALILLIAIAPLASASVTGREALEQAAELINTGRFAAAERLIEQELDAGSTSNELLYQFARLKAQQGDLEKASAGLIAAVGAGFTDFFRLARDPALEPVRDSQAYRTIAQNRATLLTDRARADFTAVQRALPRYTFRRVDDLRLQFAAAHDEQTLDQIIDEARELRDWLNEILGPPPDDPQLDPWVTVILPSPEDFVRLVGAANLGTVGGYYDPETRRLVSGDLGPSLRHELAHVFHFRRLERLGQSRPLWLTEGLAALPEALDARAESLEPVPCWRTDIARRRLAAGRLRGWNDLFTQERDRFVGHRPKAQYAQARAVALYFHQHGLWAGLIGELARTHEEDPTGLAAVAAAAGRPPEQLERAFRGWLATLGPGDPDEVGATGALGLILRAGRGLGPEIEHVEMRSVARDARMRSRDVVLAVGRRPTRTVAEFLRGVRAFHEAGESAPVRLLRGRRELTVDLAPPD